MYYGLPFLRFLCATSVVLMHAAEAAHKGSSAAHTTGAVAARIGVEVFFVISGFVMVTATADNLAAIQTRTAQAWQFMLRRFIRVAPMYWLCSAAKVALVLLIPSLAQRSSVDWLHILGSFLFIPVVSPWGLMQPILPVGWTLNFEFLFYSLFALCIVTTKWRVSLATILLSILFVTGSLTSEPGSAMHFYSRTLLFDFAMGMGIARLAQRDIQLPAPVAWLVLFLVIGMSALNERMAGAWFDLVGFGSLAGLVVWATVSLESSFLHKLKPLELLGNASYSIYLTHSFSTPGVVIVALKLAITQPLVVITAATLIPCLLGCLAYKYVEAPLTRVLRARLDPAPHTKARAA